MPCINLVISSYGPKTWYHPGEAAANMVMRRQNAVVGKGEGVSSFVHIVVLANSDPPDKLGVVALPSIPVRASVRSARGLAGRLVPRPSCPLT